MAAPRKGVKRPGLSPAPARPPAGYYDPSIDAQVAAGARGLGDYRIDYDTAKRRGLEDFEAATGALTRSRDYTLADILTGEGRTRQDHGLRTAELDRQFGVLADRQAEAARSRNVTSTGLAARSAAVRSENQGREQAGLDLARDRALTDYGTQRTRVGENFTVQSGLLDRDYQRQYGDGGDLALGLARAEREQPLLEADANDLRVQQARQAGWLPATAAERRQTGFQNFQQGLFRQSQRTTNAALAAALRRARR